MAAGHGVGKEQANLLIGFLAPFTIDFYNNVFVWQKEATEEEQARRQGVVDTLVEKFLHPQAPTAESNPT